MRDFGRGWVGVRVQERNGRHYHPGGAVGALHRCLFKEGFLQRMQTVTLGEPFNRRDSLLTDCSHRRDARSAGTSIDQDRTGTALAFSAAVLASRQIKLIAQHAE
jgi:hypothetical protein